jgi:hypothetical protein
MPTFAKAAAAKSRSFPASIRGVSSIANILSCSGHYAVAFCAAGPTVVTKVPIRSILTSSRSPSTTVAFLLKF